MRKSAGGISMTKPFSNLTMKRWISALGYVVTRSRKKEAGRAVKILYYDGLLPQPQFPLILLSLFSFSGDTLGYESTRSASACLSYRHLLPLSGQLRNEGASSNGFSDNRLFRICWLTLSSSRPCLANLGKGGAEYPKRHLPARNVMGKRVVFFWLQVLGEQLSK